MDSSRLEYFAVLVDEGTFSRAADILYISQPALSQQIRKLEEEIGAALIDRSVRPFELTATGERVYATARQVVASMHELRTLARRAGQGSQGRVRVAVAPSILLGPIAGHIRGFASAHPDVTLELERMPTSALRSHLSQRRVDAVAMYAEAGTPGTSSYLLYRESFFAAVHVSSALAHESRIRLEQLRDCQWIVRPRSVAPENYDSVIHAAVACGFSPRLKEVLGTYVEHLGFVAAGLGVTVVPESVVQVSRPDIRFIPIEQDIGMNVHLTAVEDGVDQAIGVFVSYLTNAFAREAMRLPRDPGSQRRSA